MALLYLLLLIVAVGSASALRRGERDDEDVEVASQDAGAHHLVVDTKPVKTPSCAQTDSYGYYMCGNVNLNCKGRRLFWSKQSFMTKVKGDDMNFDDSEAAWAAGQEDTMVGSMLKIAESLCPDFCIYLDWCDDWNNDWNTRWNELNGNVAWSPRHMQRIKNGLERSVGEADVFLWTEEVGTSSRFCDAERFAAKQIIADVRGKPGCGDGAHIFNPRKGNIAGEGEGCTELVMINISIAEAIPSLQNKEQAEAPYPWKKVAKLLKHTAKTDRRVQIRVARNFLEAMAAPGQARNVPQDASVE